MFLKSLKIGAAAFVALIALALAYIWIAPPDLFRVATNYSAKIVCSNVFVAGRNADEVLALDVQAPGHPILKLVSIDVDKDAQTVTTSLLKAFAPAMSKYRAGLGCTNVHSAGLSDTQLSLPDARLRTGLWPDGDDINPSQDPAIARVLEQNDLLGDGFRAAVVVKDGRVIAERYADGFDQTTPLLGWSMAKTVTAVLIGTLDQAGTLSISDTPQLGFPDWSKDARAGITVENLLAMESGLTWNEGYGNVSDVTRMLYLSDDMSGFVASQPSEAAPQEVFTYSSGTSTLLSRVWQDTLGQDSLTYPRKALFTPLGMQSALLETDAKDTFVGSSYMYATARDWARFGQFLLQKGVWQDTEILPAGFVDWMFTPTIASEELYTKGHMWRAPSKDVEPFEDAVWMRGHDGQSVGIFPSRGMVVVRMGLTPSKLKYSPLPLSQALIEAIGD